jgi:ATP-binding cassette subfamily F protein 3
MLHLNDITLRVAGRPLLEGASWHLPAGCRAALVGRNGTGKTSLFRLITGELAVDQGEVRLQSGVRIGVVAQEAPGGTASVLETALAADRERAALLARRETAPPEEQGEIETRLLEIGAAAAPARAAAILKGLGFDEAAQARPLMSFSGGWRMRVALAGVLLIEPDLLLLDEPTNHLDLEATLWLTEHLRNYPRTLLLISHDRDLLNAVPERIVHLEGGKLVGYNGNYDSFARQRAERRALLAKAQAKQAERRAQLQAFVDRFRAKASKARQAQSRLKMLERMAEIDVPPAEPEVRLAFPAIEPPPPPLITLDRVRVGYGQTVVLDRLDLRLDPDDRVALLGQNGNGKSTLAKLLAGRLAPLAGEMTIARGLKVGFFAQHQIEDLEPDQDALGHLRARRPQDRDESHRARLARFGLIQARAETPARHLSGGEKARLALTLLCLDEPNLLILDEPSNHLDIDSREALVEAITEYRGAVVLISHDRHLVEAVADRLWLVADGRVGPFDGDMDDYRRLLLEQRRGSDATAQPGHRAAGREGRLSAAERRARLAPLREAARRAEREVLALQAEQARLHQDQADPALWGDAVRRQLVARRLDELARAIAAAEDRWLEAEAAIEAVDAA